MYAPSLHVLLPLYIMIIEKVVLLYVTTVYIMRLIRHVLLVVARLIEFQQFP